MKSTLIILLQFVFAFAGGQELQIIDIVDQNRQPVVNAEIRRPGQELIKSDRTGSFIMNRNDDTYVILLHPDFIGVLLAAHQIGDSVVMVRKTYKTTSFTNHFLYQAYLTNLKMRKQSYDNLLNNNRQFYIGSMTLLDAKEMNFLFQGTNDPTVFAIPTPSIAAQNQGDSKVNVYNPSGSSKLSHSLVAGSADFLYFMLGK